MQRLSRFTPIAALLIMPFFALAHDGVDDGHIEAIDHSAGSSALLVAGSLEWWGLLFVSVLITGVLSFIVWKYLQVPPIKKQESKADSTPSVK